MTDSESTVPYGYCHCGCGNLAPLAKHTMKSRGYLKGEPKRYIAGHNRRFQTTRPRFYYTVNATTGCWIWQRQTNDRGYGYIRLRTGETLSAHRIYWERVNGPVPEGLELDHLCRNPTCVNPAHLEAVTHRENTRRAIANIDIEQARRVKHLRETSTLNSRQIAELTSVPYETVKNITNGRAWRDA